MREVKARYLLGLTATPHRRDGLQPILQLQLGAVRFTISGKSEAGERTFERRLVVLPHYAFQESGWHRTGWKTFLDEVDTREGHRVSEHCVRRNTGSQGREEGDANDAERRLKRIANLIRGFEHPYGLELLSTLHWVASHENADASEDFAKALLAFQEWSKRKEERYRPEHIKRAWDRLMNDGWLQQSTSRIN